VLAGLEPLPYHPGKDREDLDRWGKTEGREGGDRVMTLTDVFHNATALLVTTDSCPSPFPPSLPRSQLPSPPPYPEVDHVIGVDQVVGIPHRGPPRGVHCLGTIEAVELREGGRHESESVRLPRGERH